MKYTRRIYRVFWFFIGATVLLSTMAIVFHFILSTPPRPSHKCLKNLIDMSKAIKMYRLDYGAFPDTIAGYVQKDKNGTVPFDKTNGGVSVLFGKTYLDWFHCPEVSETSLTAINEISVNGETKRYYRFDSYDTHLPSPKVTGMNKIIRAYFPENDKGIVKGGPLALRYTKSWASSVKEVGKYSPYPPGTKDSVKLREEDYKRQLKWRDPPDDTVVTWCSNHKEGDNPQVLVLFLSGIVRNIPAVDVEGKDGRTGSRWRTRIPPLN